MNLLTGEYRNTLDEKGRILLPSKLRSAISGNQLVVTQGFERCLWLYLPSEWDNLSSKIMEKSSLFSAGNRLVRRRFIAPAQEIEIDKAGRLSIPQSLRSFASLSKDCVILGINKYIEIWDSDSYEKYLNENIDSLADATEELNSIGF